MKALYLLFVGLCLSAITTSAQDFNINGKKVKICINPGHGGFNGADDRNIVIYPFKQGDQKGFWESQSNLDKGLYLKHLLEQANADVIITRTQNREADDLGLDVIVDIANENNCDYMLSIHSNAGEGKVNQVLMLCSGKDPGDTYTYPDVISGENERISREYGQAVADNLYSNKVASWSSSPRVAGDKTYARTAMGWSNGYGVLRWLEVPGMISEGAMHDYIPEAYRLMNMDYKHQEAWYFYKTFCTYFNAGEESVGKIAGWIRNEWETFNNGFPVGQNYNSLPSSPDRFCPINGVKVSLLGSEDTVIKSYTTDEMYNGYFLLDSIQPGSYRLKMEKEHYITMVQDVVVGANTITYKNTWLDKDRSEPLIIKSYTPNITNVPISAGTHLRFCFNFELDKESFENGFKIVPAVEGTFKYEQFDRVITFIPNKPLERSTDYIVTLDKSIKHIGGLGLADDFVLNFTTKDKNDLNLLEYYPQDGAENIFPAMMFKFFFDTKLDSRQLMNQFFILKEVVGENVVPVAGYDINLCSEGLGAYAAKMNLKPNTEYQLKMDKLVQSEDSIPVGIEKVIRFKTGSDVVLGEGLIESFEDNGLFTIDDQQTVNIDKDKTTIKRLTGTSVESKRSYRLSYVFTGNDGYATINYTKTLAVNNGNYIGLYVYGDLSFNKLNLIFSNGTNEKEVLLTELDFAGWRFCEAKVEGIAGSGYVLKGFKFVSSGSAYSQIGEVMFDNLLINADSYTVIDILERQDVKYLLQENPVKDQLVIINTGSIEKVQYQVISVSGNVIQTGWLSFDKENTSVPVGCLSSGYYILKLSNSSYSSACPFIKQ